MNNEIEKETNNADLVSVGYSVAPSRSKIGKFRWWLDTNGDGISVPVRDCSEQSFTTENDAWADARRDALASGVLANAQRKQPQQRFPLGSQPRDTLTLGQLLDTNFSRRLTEQANVPTVAAANLTQLESFLRTTHADQGGETTFEQWVRATAADAEEVGYSEAVEYLRLDGDMRDKDLGADEQWKLPEVQSMRRLMLMPSGRFITDEQGRKVAEMFQPGDSPAEREAIKSRIVGSFNALPSLVGVLLRADKEGALWQALYNEAITDAYDAALSDAVKALGDEGVATVAHLYELDVEVIRAKIEVA